MAAICNANPDRGFDPQSDNPNLSFPCGEGGGTAGPCVIRCYLQDRTTVATDH